MKDVDEQQMLDDCIHNNRCGEIVRQYWNLVAAVIRKTFTLKRAQLRREELEEVRQEVFVRLLEDDRRRLAMYTETAGAGLARWIAVIANRTTLNHLRKRGFDSPAWSVRKDELREDIPDPRDRETEIINRISVDAAQGVLSQTDRIVFKLHRFGLSAKDIANIIDSTEDGVHSKIYRIKKTLREVLNY